VRTAKYPIQSSSDRIANTTYRHGNRWWVAVIEILAGCYFVFAVYYAARNAYYLTVPFLCLFVLGYLGGGLLSLLQGKWQRWVGSPSRPSVAPVLRPVAEPVQES
jgi:hypothetical protein